MKSLRQIKMLNFTAALHNLHPKPIKSRRHWSKVIHHEVIFTLSITFWIIPFRMKPSRKKMRTIHIMMMIVLTLDLLKIQVFLFQVLRWQFSIESDMIFTLRVPTLNWTFVCWREALTHQKTSPPLRRFTERVKMRQEEMWSSVVDFDTNFWSSY